MTFYEQQFLSISISLLSGRSLNLITFIIIEQCVTNCGQKLPTLRTTHKNKPNEPKQKNVFLRTTNWNENKKLAGKMIENNSGYGSFHIYITKNPPTENSGQFI